MEPNHYHNGVDNFRLYPKDFHGFPILNSIPDYRTEDGTWTFSVVGNQVYIYAMINKVWERMATASTLIQNTGTLNFGAITPNSSADLTLALVGAVDTDIISLGVANAVIASGTNSTNISFFAWVSASGVVTVRCTNHDLVNTANPASGTFRVMTTQF